MGWTLRVSVMGHSVSGTSICICRSQQRLCACSAPTPPRLCAPTPPRLCGICFYDEMPCDEFTQCCMVSLYKKCIDTWRTSHMYGLRHAADRRSSRYESEHDDGGSRTMIARREIYVSKPINDTRKCPVYHRDMPSRHCIGMGHGRGP